MGVTEQLIKKFLDGACSEEEAEDVSRYLKAHPDALDKYLDIDWEESLPDKEMPDAFWQESWKEIDERKQPAGRVLNFKMMAAAAGIAIAVFAGGYFMLHQPRGNAGTETVYTSRTISNRSSHDTTFFLQDHSEVRLAAGSAISFDEPFQQNKRDIHLLGEGFFIVAKDPAKPFTVYSNELSTTALGTQFRVISFSGDHTIEVQLMEGKVVVKPRGQSGNAGRNYYLSPGEVLRYDRLQMTTKVNTVYTDTAAKEKTTVATVKLPPALVKTNGKQPLSSVLDQLSKMYSVTILYNPGDLQNRYFIGKLDKSESLDKALNTICKLHGLKLEKINTGKYKINK